MFRKKSLVFTIQVLGSELGSTWFLKPSLSRNGIVQSISAWFRGWFHLVQHVTQNNRVHGIVLYKAYGAWLLSIRAWFHLVPETITFAEWYCAKHICLVPGLVPLGSERSSKAIMLSGGSRLGRSLISELPNPASSPFSHFRWGSHSTCVEPNEK